MGCASVEPFEGVPDGGGAVLSLGTGGTPSQAGGGATPGNTGTGGDSNAVAGNAGGAPSGGAGSGGSAGAPAGGSAGSCYVAGCPGCILSQNSLFGVPCCTPAGKCGCQAVFTTTCM
jgi:hypothetical protein